MAENETKMKKTIQNNQKTIAKICDCFFVYVGSITQLLTSFYKEYIIKRSKKCIFSERRELDATGKKCEPVFTER